MRPETLLARSGHGDSDAVGSVVPPLHLTTTFARDEDYDLVGPFVYRRYGSPTVEQAEEVLRRLEGGDRALCFASGLSATAALLEILPAGARVLAPRVMYHGAQDRMRDLDERGLIELELFDPTEDGALARALETRGAELVWVEALANPTWDVIDIEACARAASAAGAMLVVDSTVAPPVTTRPLDLGATVVLHSTTKYLTGHSDSMGGVLIGSTDAIDWEGLVHSRKLTGTIMPPLDAWLLLRGLRTLALRFERASANALTVARYLAEHAAVERCLYPGLPSHPGHELASRQMTGGFGGMLSALVHGGAERAVEIATSLRCFIPATSLGGVESLVEHRASVEGPHSTVPGNLLRFSIGIEHETDLVADLERVLGP